MKQELESTQRRSDEALKAVRAQLSATTDELGREVAAREQLEMILGDLEQELEQEKSNTLSERDVALLRQEWEEEMRSLLDSIQKDCNQVFDRSSSKSSRSSPRSVLFDGAEHGESKSRCDGRAGTFAPRASMYESSNWSDIDRALDETEAMVRSLIGT